MNKTLPLTIDEAISTLQRFKEKSILGGETCLYVCFPNGEAGDFEINNIYLEQDKDGAIAYFICEGDIIG